MSALSSAIRLYELTVAYGREPALSQVTGSFAAGSLTAVMGPNGAGKTTLLKAIAGLLPPGAGRVELVGADRGQVAYLPQRAEIDRSFPIAVQDVVGLGHWRRSGALRSLGQAGAKAVARALAMVGLEGFRTAADRQRFPPASSSASCSPACSSRTARSCCSTSRSRRSMPGPRPICCEIDPRLAPARAGPWSSFSTIWSRCGASFPETLLLARAVIDWGPTGAGAQPGQSAARLGHAAGWHERPAPGSSGCAARHERLRAADRAVRRLRVHAPGAGRLPGACDGLRSGRDHPVAAADEPDGRCARPCGAARRRGRLSRRRPVAAPR